MSLRPRSLVAAISACALTAGLGLRIAHAETPMGVKSLAEAKSDYQHDLAACRDRTVDEDMKTCRLEANRAYAEAKREVSRHGGKSMSTRHAKAKTSKSNETSATTSGTGSSAPESGK